MDWTVIGVGLSAVALIYAMIRNFRKDMDEKFKVLGDEFREEYKENNKRWIETNKRMDGVYHILLKRIGEE